jgi:hypothetical protein
MSIVGKIECNGLIKGQFVRTSDLLIGDAQIRGQRDCAGGPDVRERQGHDSCRPRLRDRTRVENPTDAPVADTQPPHDPHMRNRLLVPFAPGRALWLP